MFGGGDVGLEGSLADAKGNGVVFAQVDPDLVGFGVGVGLQDGPDRDTTVRKAFTNTHMIGVVQLTPRTLGDSTIEMLDLVDVLSQGQSTASETRIHSRRSLGRGHRKCRPCLPRRGCRSETISEEESSA